MIYPIEECCEIKDVSIFNRSKESSKGKFTKHYLAYNGNEEIAFISLDVNNKLEYVVLYDLLVPFHKRHAEHGTSVLRGIEQLISNMGFQKIVLNPEPYERDYPKEKLVNWYKSKGYNFINNGTGQMEKVILRKCT